MLFSCAVTHANNFYIYGGEIHRRQVLQLVDCGLTSIGTLSFEHYYGAYGSSIDLILLCFDYTDAKQCRYASRDRAVRSVESNDRVNMASSENFNRHHAR